MTELLYLFNVVILTSLLSAKTVKESPSSSVTKYRERNEAEIEVYKGKMNITLPEKITERVQLVHQIRSNRKIIELKANLSKLLPDLVFYTARELKEYTYNKVGGPADILIFPKTFDEVQSVLSFARNNEIPFTFLGKGSNVIIRDGGIRGITIITRELSYFKLDDEEFIAGTGAELAEAAYFLLERNKSNFEWAVGIPGSIGGAVYMNAGAYGDETQYCLKSVKFIDEDGKVKTLDVKDLKFKKRYSIFHENCRWFILEATFKIKNGNTTEMEKRMQDTVQLRENRFPLEYPQHGCTYKKPTNSTRLIQEAGLPGTQIGGVMISKKHPNFFVNVNQGTAADYEKLINHTTSKVYEVSGLLLELEVEFFGEHVELAIATEELQKSKKGVKSAKRQKNRKT